MLPKRLSLSSFSFPFSILHIVNYSKFDSNINYDYFRKGMYVELILKLVLNCHSLEGLV